jgi:hypothetical protein
MSAAATVRFASGGLYLMPDLIVIVSVLPPFETFGSPVARSGDGTVWSGFHPYSHRWVGCAISV